MSIEVWFLYVVSIFVVILIPGPLSLYMVSNSINYGVIRSYPAFLGGTLASSLYLIVSATGLGAILTASENMFLILKLMGALYLVYLGVDTIRKSMADTARKSLNGCSLEFPGFNNLFKKLFCWEPVIQKILFSLWLSCLSLSVEIMILCNKY